VAAKWAGQPARLENTPNRPVTAAELLEAPLLGYSLQGTINAPE
jgi:hypothetical protein